MRNTKRSAITREARSAGPGSPDKAGGPTSSRTCILILGMHRSGTSALTRVLNLLGVELPRNLMKADPSNQTGYWESRSLYALHDQMLAEVGSAWNDWRALDLAVLPQQRRDHYKNEVKRLVVEEFGKATLFVIKDPRICRYVAFYEEILSELQVEVRFLIPYRNPLAVIASLNERDAMTTSYTRLLWLRHVIDAEAATRGRLRAFVSYEKLLDDWRRSLTNVAGLLDLNWPISTELAAAKIEQHLARHLQHHAASVDELIDPPNSNTWTSKCYAALRQLEEVPSGGKRAIRQLSQIKLDFDASSKFFGDAMFPEFASQQICVNQMTSQLVQLSSQFQEVVSNANAERSVLELEKVELRAKEAHLRDALDRIHSSASWKITSPLRAFDSGWRQLRHLLGIAKNFVAHKTQRAWRAFHALVMNK